MGEKVQSGRRENIILIIFGINKQVYKLYCVDKYVCMNDYDISIYI